MNISRTNRLARYLTRLAAQDIGQRIRSLVKRYPGISEDYIRELLQYDPTQNRAQYLEWLVREDYQRHLSGESLNDVRTALFAFDKVKRSPKLQQQFDLVGRMNIMTYNVGSLLDLYNKIEEATTWGDRLQKVQRVVYDKPPYKVIGVFGDEDPEAAVRALCKLGVGTQWCTRFPNYAKSYLESDSQYVVFKNGEPYLQTDGIENFTGTDDELIDPQDEPEIFELLERLHIINENGELHQKYYRDDEYNEDDEDDELNTEEYVLQSNLEHQQSTGQVNLDHLEKALGYEFIDYGNIKEILSDNVFFEAICSAMTSPEDTDLFELYLSRVYGDVANEEHEQIMQHIPAAAVAYGIWTGQPFPAGEAVILTQPAWAVTYAIEVLRHPWPQLELELRDHPVERARYLAAFPQRATARELRVPAPGQQTFPWYRGQNPTSSRRSKSHERFSFGPMY